MWRNGSSCPLNWDCNFIHILLKIQLYRQLTFHFRQGTGTKILGRLSVVMMMSQCIWRHCYCSFPQKCKVGYSLPSLCASAPPQFHFISNFKNGIKSIFKVSDSSTLIPQHKTILNPGLPSYFYNGGSILVFKSQLSGPLRADLLQTHRLSLNSALKLDSMSGKLSNVNSSLRTNESTLDYSVNSWVWVYPHDLNVNSSAGRQFSLFLQIITSCVLPQASLI